MKIKNVFLASLLTKLGADVKAELIIDDSNGTSLTFPEISDVSEIAEGVAVSAPDGTYVIANGEDAITIVVLSGVISTMEVSTPDVEGSTDSELETVLEAIVEENVALKGEVTALKGELSTFKAEFTALKVALKHDDGKGAAAAAATSTKLNFKVV